MMKAATKKKKKKKKKRKKQTGPKLRLGKKEPPRVSILPAVTSRQGISADGNKLLLPDIVKPTHTLADVVAVQTSPGLTWEMHGEVKSNLAQQKMVACSLRFQLNSKEKALENLTNAFEELQAKYVTVHILSLPPTSLALSTPYHNAPYVPL